MRLSCGVRDDGVYRPGWPLRLNLTHLAFAVLIDGPRSIREIAAAVADGDGAGRGEAAELEYIAVELLEGLWLLDFVAVDLSRLA